MPLRSTFLPKPLIDLSHTLGFEQQLEDGLASLRFHSALPDALQSIEDTYRRFSQPAEAPIIVSDRPDQARIARQQQAQMDEQPTQGLLTTPQTPQTPQTPSLTPQQPPVAASGTPVAMPGGGAPAADGPEWGPPSGPQSGSIEGTDRPTRIASAYRFARAAEQRTGVPAEVSLAFAVHESGLEDRYGPGFSYHGRQCYDAATEVLTGRGWVPWPYARVTDLFATWDEFSGTVEWTRASHVVRYPYSGNMLHVVSGDVDLLVTPEHRMWVTRGASEPFQFTRARDVLGQKVGYLTLPLLSERCEVPTLRDAILSVVRDRAEEQVSRSDARRVVTAVANHLRWDQRNSVLNLVRDTVSAGLLWAYAIIARQQRVKLAVATTIKRSRPDPARPELWSDDRAVLVDLRPESLLAGAEVGTPAGTRAEAGVALLDDNRHSQKVGAASLTHAGHGTLVGHRWTPTKSFDVCPGRVSDGSGHRVDYTTTSSWVGYEGTVYCATVPSGLLVVRRNGKTVVSGNSLPGERGTPYKDWRPGPNGEQIFYDSALKAYDGPQDSFDDFADLVATAPRYRPALDRYRQTGDKAQLIRDIWAAGYGESPTGPDETVDIMNRQVSPLAGQAAQPQVQRPSAPSGQPAAMPQASASPNAVSDGLAFTPDQGALDDPDKWALCGPVAAVAMARARGGNWTVAQAKKYAQDNGLWNAERGMGGLETEAQLLRGMGYAASAGALDWQRAMQDAQSGNPVTLSTTFIPGGHYVVLEKYDPQTGKFLVGGLGNVLKKTTGRSNWYTPQELEALGGIQGALHFDNPASPTPSVAVADPNAAPSQSPAGAAAPPAPAGAASPPAGATPLAQIGVQEPQTQAAYGDTFPPPEDEPFDPRDADSGPHESRPVVSSYNDPTAYPQTPVPIPPVVGANDPGADGGYPAPLQTPINPPNVSPVSPNPRTPVVAPNDDPGGAVFARNDAASTPLPYDNRIADEEAGARELPRAAHRPGILPRVEVPSWVPTPDQVISGAEAGYAATGVHPWANPATIARMVRGFSQSQYEDWEKRQDRMTQIQDHAARYLGMDPNDPTVRVRAPGDARYRAAFPDIAAEYDDLQNEETQAVAGQVGDTANVVRGAAGLARRARGAQGLARGGRADDFTTSARAAADDLARGMPTQEPGVMQLGSGVVPEGAAGVPDTLSPVGRRVMDAYARETPVRTEEAARQSIDEVTNQLVGMGATPDQARSFMTAVHNAIQRRLGQSKIVATGFRPGALTEFLTTGRLTSKTEVDDLDQIVEITRQQVNNAGKRMLRQPDGSLVAAPYTTEEARSFVLRQALEHDMVAGGNRFPNTSGVRDEAAPGTLYAYVTEGQPLVGPNTPTIWGVWQPRTPRAVSAHHEFALGSPGQDIHAKMPSGYRNVLWPSETNQSVRGAKIGTAPFDNQPILTDYGRVPVGEGRSIADTPFLVDQSGEDAMRANGLILSIPDGIRRAIAQGRMTDPEQVASVLMRGGGVRNREYRGFGAAQSATRSEAIIIDPHAANLQAIYISGPEGILNRRVPNVPNAQGKTGMTTLETAQAVRARIKADTGNDVPIYYLNTSKPGGSKLITDAQLLEGPPIQGGLAPGRADIVNQYTQAINPETKLPYENIGTGVVPSPLSGLRPTAINAAQGGVAGALSEDLQAQQEGREADPNERLRRAAGGAVLAGAAGRLARGRGGKALGSGFVNSPRYKPPTPQQIAKAEREGARLGARLNQEVRAPASEVPRSVRAAVAATDDRAGLRWAEDMLSDAAGNPRMRENDPARPSTQSRVNSGAIANERIQNELEAPVINAARNGLQDELPQHVRDMHARDILNEFYERGYTKVKEARQPAIDRAKAAGKPQAVIQRMEAKAEADAHAAGEATMRKRQGGNPDMTYEAIEARLQAQEARLKASGQWDALQESAQGVWDAARNTRQRLVDAGELDPADAAYYAATYPHYVPTVPISHLDARSGGPVASASGPRISRGSQKAVNALEDVGTSGETLNPIVAVRNQIVRAERQMQRNRVAQAFAQMMDDALGASPGTMGVDAATHRTFLGGGTDVTYMANGKPVTISVPKVVADGIEAAANMSADPGTITRIWRSIMGTFTSAMTAARPSFLAVNVVRDLQDFALRTASHEGGVHALPSVLGTWANEAGRAVADIAKAQANVRGGAGAAVGGIYGASIGDEDTTVAERIRHAAEGAVAGTFLGGANRVKATGKAREYLARGGGSGGVSAHWGAGQRWYRDVMREGGAVIKNPQDAARYLGDWLKDVATLQGIKGINERAELVSRTAAMRRADAQGLNPTEAMTRGRDASYDPDRAGTVARAVNGIVPFFNASVQGAAQTGRLLREHPIAAPLTIAATVAPVMLLAEAWNRSDPDRARIYDDIPQYIKDSGLVVVTGTSGSDNRGERPNYLWIPTGGTTPYVIGLRKAMEGLPGLETTAGRTGSRPEASEIERWGDTLATIASVFSPIRGESPSALASNLVPQGVKQVVEVGLNKDLYRGNPIVTDNADERASAFSRSVAGGVNTVGRTLGSDALQNVHPSQVEHLVRSLPAYGDIVTGASDQVAPSGYKQSEDRPVANEPFLGGVAGRFVRDQGGANLERAQGGMLSDNVRNVLDDAGMRPEDVQPVSSRWKNGPLTRDEMERWQDAMNRELDRMIARARREPTWRNPATREGAVRKAISDAKEQAALKARLPSESQMQRRIRDEQRMKAS